MAVSARVSTATDQFGLQVRMHWDFYDPTDPLNTGVNGSTPPGKILHHEEMMIDPGAASVPVITARIQVIANRLALAQPIITSLNVNVPAGTVVPLA